MAAEAAEPDSAQCDRPWHLRDPGSSPLPMITEMVEAWSMRQDCGWHATILSAGVGACAAGLAPSAPPSEQMPRMQMPAAAADVAGKQVSDGDREGQEQGLGRYVGSDDDRWPSLGLYRTAMHVHHHAQEQQRRDHRHFGHQLGQQQGQQQQQQEEGVKHSYTVSCCSTAEVGWDSDPEVGRLGCYGDGGSDGGSAASQRLGQRQALVRACSDGGTRAEASDGGGGDHSCTWHSTSQPPQTPQHHGQRQQQQQPSLGQQQQQQGMQEVIQVAMVVERLDVGGRLTHGSPWSLPGGTASALAAPPVRVRLLRQRSVGMTRKRVLV
ncbi:hypothetical protein VOLCADRAFT_98433 [Volvox carteri f. nagariensis]|uniref:Uncharacterized protein n=1 Tax=Volvox carteri f. nagariensis TaxID=3068 RepID=D8UFB8_VOLCA|nr:uncharacterized protein VOLCADRAFT_98433 [Volvox carteri f. nagariensis]EFJ41580.1 hypothetical protein VOLCADRAFT_98433 [Volvox carteri f. nagariensis]|eukprot:XP_002957371.1 hypothetical protein VOLCADRAFT_98433 [Volvox carteri f. nagariensis]